MSKELKFNSNRATLELNAAASGALYLEIEEGDECAYIKLSLAEASKLHKWLGARLIEAASGNRTKFSDMIKDGTLEPLRKPTPKRNSGIKWQVFSDGILTFVVGSLEGDTPKRQAVAICRDGSYVSEASVLKHAIECVTVSLLGKGA